MDIDDANNEWLEQDLEAPLFDSVNRLEVIGPHGREYVRYFKDDEYMKYMIQDEGRTLKIFIED